MEVDDDDEEEEEEVRIFEKPSNALVLNSEHYSDMIDWHAITITEPPMTKSILELDELIFFKCPDYPCHDQKIKQLVKLTSQVTRCVSDPAKQEADALITHQDRFKRPLSASKQDFQI